MENEKVIFNHPVPQNFRAIPIEEDHYILGDGNLVSEILMPNGHGWGDFLPIGEPQSNSKVETSCCPVYGTLNIIEALGRFKYGTAFNPKPGSKPFQNNLSDRYLSIMAGLNGTGGNPHQVAEVLRTLAGSIPEVFLPFSDKIDTLAKFFSPRPISYDLFKTGYHWLNSYSFGHDWIFPYGVTVDKKALVKEALKYSPVGVAGYAWSLHSDGKYYNDGDPIHWFVVFDYVEGEYWLAFDSYFPYVKKLDWNYNFAYAKRYSLSRKLGAEETLDAKPQSAILPYIKYLIQNFFNLQ